LVGGTGGTTYLFSNALLPAGGTFGSTTVTQTSDAQDDTIDFSQFVGPVALSLDPAEANVAQAVGGGLTLTLTNPQGIANLVGNSADPTFTGNSRANRFTLGGGDNTVIGGGGADTYVFAGHLQGTDTILDYGPGQTAHPVSTDTLNFLGMAAPIDLHLAQAGPQEVSPGFSLWLADPEAFSAVVGTPYADTILGNSQNDTLVGAGGDDLLVGGPGSDVIQGNLTQVVYLDFSQAPAGSHVYTADERADILRRLESDYAAFNYSFFTDLNAAEQAAAVTGGAGVSIVFNAGPAGGKSDDLDFRNLNLAGDATVNAVPLLGGPGQPAATSANFVLLSTEIAAHELGHLSGLRHADSFGPILQADSSGLLGGGIFAGVDPRAYAPAYPGPFDAFTTPLHIMASPDSVGVSLADSTGATYFGEREAVKLAFADTGTVVAQAAGNGSFGTAQALGTQDGLPGLTVPNTLQSASEPDFGKVFQVRAIDVTGAVTANQADDFYSFAGKAGDVMNFEAMSSALSRNAHPFDPVLTLFDASGKVLVSNDNEFETKDSAIIDYQLPADGTYYAEVAPNTPLTDSEGDYELFFYSFAAAAPPAQGTAAAPTALTLGTGDTLVAGSGSDTLIGSSGNDQFAFPFGATGSAAIQLGSGSGTVNQYGAPGERVTVSGTVAGTFLYTTAQDGSGAQVLPIPVGTATPLTYPDHAPQLTPP
ncbi:MAG TPA: pre-peptidase C-terminal domain-containing protein, partial [Gemmataceae bacterium]|nr:pre-peptidase C-terminal domain-containing protein [Gemmataceae bacterium]